MKSQASSTLLLAYFGLVFTICLYLAPATEGQAFSVIHTFTGADGEYPLAGFTIDRAGSLYGTTYGGGSHYSGEVFRLMPMGSTWTFDLLHSFKWGQDGAYPWSGVTFGPGGTLYGATDQGGYGCYGDGCGTVYDLRPSPTPCTTALCDWDEAVLHRFLGTNDGKGAIGNLAFDSAGHIYGTAVTGGFGSGVVYELTAFDDGWAEHPIHLFTGPDGARPQSGVIFDQAGNLYGTAPQGGANNYGTIFRLTPSGAGWTENTIYSFTGGGDGAYPVGGLISDAIGNLYGATAAGGINGGGTVYKLTPSAGGWSFNLLYSFSGSGAPEASLLLDTEGNIYGTTYAGGPFGYGSVFKLSPSDSGWIYTPLYGFSGGRDGSNPISNVVFDASGNLYGTAELGGSVYCGVNHSGCGVVWEITR